VIIFEVCLFCIRFVFVKRLVNFNSVCVFVLIFSCVISVCNTDYWLELLYELSLGLTIAVKILGDPVPVWVCGSKPRWICSACKNLKIQYPVRPKI